MGLFSRKKSPKSVNGRAIKTQQSNASLNSGQSSLKSPPPTTRNGFGRTSGQSTNPSTPLTPFSPVNMPKIDLPRPPDPNLDPAGYLKSLGAVRDRSKIVVDKALKNELKHFDVDMLRFPDVVTFVSRIIKVGLETSG
jgi:hypothetical protein